ncbi:MAG: ABC transporter substrate-binding protein [Sphaerochaetaceae bacterium]|nr:ABC transporter substrate-binding protein [Sphaerochaetaceae bacterium]
MKKKLLIALMICLIGMFAFAIGEAEESNVTEDGLQKVTISIHPSGHGLPSYVADVNGYYEDEGLSVKTLVYIGAPPQMEAYSTGAWDICTTGFGGIILGAAKKDLVITGVSIDDGMVMGLWGRPDSELVKSGYNEEIGAYGNADLWKGQDILMTQGTITDVLLNSTLNKMGLTEMDVKKVNMDSSPAYTAFKSNNGDLCQANASFYFNAKADGYIPVTTGVSQGIFMPSVMMASEKIINERPEVVQAWTNAYMRAVQWIKDNPEEAGQMMVDFCEENGVSTVYNKALEFVNAQVVEIPDVQGQLDMFGPAEDGNGTKWQSSLSQLMDFYITMGNYSEADKAALMLDENYDSSFMQNLV